MENVLRMRGALASLPFIKKEHEKLLTEWLSFIASPAETGVTISVSATANLDQTAWRVQHEDKKALVQRYANFAKGAGFFSETEANLLKKALGDLKGDFNVWMRIGDELQDTGWEINNELFPMKAIWGLIPNNPDKANLAAWYEAMEADAVVRFGRCLAGNAYSYFSTELFGDNATQDMELYMNLCDKMGVTPLPTPLLELIAEEEPEFIEISYWLGSNGLLRVGLIVPEPSETFLTKVALVLGGGDTDMLAAYEGSLGDVVVSSVEIARTATGIEAELVYSY